MRTPPKKHAATNRVRCNPPSSLATGERGSPLSTTGWYLSYCRLFGFAERAVGQVSFTWTVPTKKSAKNRISFVRGPREHETAQACHQLTQRSKKTQASGLTDLKNMTNPFLTIFSVAVFGRRFTEFAVGRQRERLPGEVQEHI